MDLIVGCLGPILYNQLLKLTHLNDFETNHMQISTI